MSIQVTHTALRLRPISEKDYDLLYTIYASTRATEMDRLTHWTEEQKTAFLRMQFEAQHDWYQKNYKGAFFWIIECNGKPAGRLYLHPRYVLDGMRIIDIALLPGWRNQGIGSGLLRDIMAYARREAKAVSIHVESFNRAKLLYQKLGFRFVSATNGVYHLMEWTTPQTVSA